MISSMFPKSFPVFYLQIRIGSQNRKEILLVA